MKYCILYSRKIWQEITYKFSSFGRSPKYTLPIAIKSFLHIYFVHAKVKKESMGVVFGLSCEMYCLLKSPRTDLLRLVLVHPSVQDNHLLMIGLQIVLKKLCPCLQLLVLTCMLIDCLCSKQLLKHRFEAWLDRTSLSSQIKLTNIVVHGG